MSSLSLAGSRDAAAQGTRAILIASSAAVALAAWVWLGRASTSHGMHSALLGRSHREAGATSFLSALVMWQAMTLAMMTPVFLRWALVFAHLTATPDRGRLGRVASLASAYFVVWLIYSVGGAAIQVSLQARGLLASGKIGGVAAGVVLIAAGLFQFTPFRRACLTHCRNPLTYFVSRWRGAPAGAFRLGIQHGAYCVGCCWLLMMTGLAMGLMNLAWMAVLTLVIAAEQVLPRGDRIARAAGVALVGWGLVLLM